MRIPLALILVGCSLTVSLGCSSDRGADEVAPTDETPADEAPTGEATEAEREGLALAREILTTAGAAAQVTADLVMSIRPAKGDSLSFTINTWCAQDGSLRLLANKVNFDGLDALISADGQFTALLIKTSEVFTGQVDELAAAQTEMTPAMSFLTNVQRLTDEVRRGSVAPSADRYVLEGRDDDGNRILRIDHPGGGQERLGVGNHRDGPIVVWRELLADGERVAHFAYSRHERKDGLLRFGRVTVTRPEDEGSVVIRLRDIDRVPGFRAGTFTITAPPEWPEIDVDTFVQRLQED